MNKFKSTLLSSLLFAFSAVTMYLKKGYVDKYVYIMAVLCLLFFFISVFVRYKSKSVESTV